MLMNKKILILVLIIVLVFGISGCSLDSLRKSKDTKDIDYNKGTQGLTLEFLSNTPPNEAWADSTLPIQIKVMNLGSTTIGTKTDETEGYLLGGQGSGYEGGYLVLTGYDPQYIYQGTKGTRIEAKDLGILNARNRFNPMGDLKILDFNPDISKLEEVLYDYIEQPVVAMVCYIYRTKASPNVCLSSKTVDIENDPCKVSDITLDSQAAPVAVKKIEVSAAPRDNMIDYIFVIHIKNVGNGEVVVQDMIYRDESNKGEACIAPSTSKIPSYQQLNRVYIEDLRVGNKVFPGKNVAGSGCERLDIFKGEGGYSYDNVVILDDKGEGLAAFKCKFDQEELRTPYETPLNIKIKYGYRERVSKVIKINKRSEEVINLENKQ